jgi:Peptidase family M1 domain/Peptidase M1 N-terminal domain/Secretion system C-terminal sorting domain
MKRSLISLIIFLLPIFAFSQEKQPIKEKEFFQQEISRYRTLFEHRQQENILAGETFDVTYYKINFKLTIESTYLSGYVRMEAISKVSNLSAITLDLMNSMTVDSVKAGGVTAAFVQNPTTVDITLDRSYLNGELFTVYVFYQGVPGSSGFGSFEFYSHGSPSTPWIWSLSEPYGAKDWWPCKDHPSDKADSVDMFVTCNSAYKVGSNGKLLSVTDNGDGTSTHHWKEVYPISTYLVMIAVTNYAQFSNWFKYTLTDSMEILNYVLPEHLASAQSGLPVAVTGLQIFSNLFGLYPFINEKFGHAEFGWGGGMEHQTMTSLTGFGEGLVIHELAHEWFGDMITCRNWPDLWLNEGFATYCEALYNEVKYGKSSYFGSMNSEMSSAKSASGTLYLQDTSGVGSMFGYANVYAKGATVLHMLRHAMGDSLFFKAMYNYANDPRFKYGTAKSTDFQEVCETTSGMDLDYFFNEWVFGESYPRYEYSWNAQPEGDMYSVSVTVGQSTPTSNPSFFTMPLDLKVTGTGLDTTVTVFNNAIQQTFTFTVAKNPTNIQLDPEGWIMKGLVSGNISILPLTKYFGNVVIGIGKIDSGTVTNYGAASITVTTSSNHPDFTVSPSSIVIAPSQSKKYYMTFTPSSIGNKTGVALFAYSGIGSPDSVIVSGYGVYPTFSYQMLNNWNMISVPVTVGDLQKSTLFPTAVSDAFIYDNGSGNYIPEATLEYGRGYWIKFSGAQQVSIQGAVRESDTVDVISGWNLIGTLSEPIATDAIEKDPVEMNTSEYFGFDGAYVMSDSIFPSKGYWVKSDQAGKLFFKSGVVLSNTRSITEQLENYQKIIIHDADGHSQTLYFGQGRAGINNITFDMPPLPPEGVFDVRFATNSLFWSSTLNHSNEADIKLNSVKFPLTISWEHISDENSYSLMVDDNIIDVNGNGEMSIPQQPKRLSLKVNSGNIESVPHAFALKQNYPNPFNPVTQIFYELPVDCHVSLRIYDALGREVAVLVDEYQKAGYKTSTFSAGDLSSGFYFYKISAGGFVEVKKMLILR